MWGEESPDWELEGEERKEGVHSCHTECQMMAPCEACHLSDWWGGWGWGEGKCACGWGCTREKEYGCCWSPLAYIFMHTHQYCAHMQIYKHSGINQRRKKEDRHSSLQADCSCMLWPPLKSSFSSPIHSFFIFLSHSPLLPYFTSVSTLPLYSSQATALPLCPPPPPPITLFYPSLSNLNTQSCISLMQTIISIQKC